MTQSQSYSTNTNAGRKYNNLLLSDQTGKRLRKLREDRSITQFELGQTLGYTQEAISQKESGKRQISGYEIVRFSQALELSTPEIIYLLLGIKSE